MNNTKLTENNKDIEISKTNTQHLRMIHQKTILIVRYYTTEPDKFFLRFIAYVFQLSILHVDVMQLISANMILFFSLVITKRPSA
jgi:hypothetical protein